MLLIDLMECGYPLNEINYQIIENFTNWEQNSQMDSFRNFVTIILNESHHKIVYDLFTSLMSQLPNSQIGYGPKKLKK